MRDVIVSIFGTYSPTMTDVYSPSGEFVGTAVASGLAGVDWPYIAGVFLFAVVLIGALRLLRGLFYAA